MAIAIGIRKAKRDAITPGKVRYGKIEGDTREEKLSSLDSITSFSEVSWQDCSDQWLAPFMPLGKGMYFDWPKVIDLFPYHTAGAVFYRSWPIGETSEVLRARWLKLKGSSSSARSSLFKTSRDRKCDYTVNHADLPGYGEPSVSALKSNSNEPNLIRYGFRSFDRQLAFYDFRLGDFIRPVLSRLSSDRQIFLICPDSLICGHGAICVASAYLPDQHFFRGSFGGKDVIPLFRDAAGTEPNITGGLLDALGKEYGVTPTAEDLAAYVYAVLGGQSYTRRFWNELETPGPRVPLTRDGKTFAAATKLGRKLIWLHTYAERFRGEDRGEEVPQGKATTIKGVSSDTAHYPVEYGYDPAKQEVAVGDGRFGPVAPEVWEFEVSGFKVVQSWLGYRMKRRAGKKSSPLDDIRPERWTARMSDELLELLWVLESTLATELELEKALDKVVAGPCFTAAELPTPKPEERKAPGSVSAGTALLGLMGINEEDDDVAAEDDDD